MTLTTEQQIAAAKVAYDQAQEAETLAKKNLEDLKAGSKAITDAYEAAKKAFEGLKPSLNVAKAQVQAATAQVTITRTNLLALDPKAIPSPGKGTGNKELLGHVTALLTGKPDGMENGAIFDALTAAGVALAGAKARENLNSYLSRWGAVEAGGIVSAGTGKWKLKDATAAPAATIEVPAGLPAGLVAPAEVPAAAPAGLPPGLTSTPLTEDFPGYEPLKAAGYTTREQLVGKTAEDLTAIPGIGGKTAEKILAALA